MFKNPLALPIISGIVSACVVGAISWNLAYGRGYNAATIKAEIVIASKNKDLQTANGDLSQCRQANQNYHSAVTDQLKLIQAELASNLQRQNDAATKNASADRRMLDAATKSAENAEAARRAILNAVDQCVRAGVPADLVGVLNGILPSGGAGIAAGGNAVPGQ